MSSAHPQAIQTFYHNCLFRGRMEARWAVFLDALGLKWHYETEGYNLPSGRYLPDFFVPALGLRTTLNPQGLYIESKHEGYSDDPFHQDQRHWDFVEAVQKSLLVLAERSVCNDYNGNKYQIMWQEDVGPRWDNFMVFAQCFSCGRFKVEFSNAAYMICESCQGCMSPRTPDLQNAVMAACSARFEYGEIPWLPPTLPAPPIYMRGLSQCSHPTATCTISAAVCNHAAASVQPAKSEGAAAALARARAALEPVHFPFD